MRPARTDNVSARSRPGGQPPAVGRVADRSQRRRRRPAWLVPSGVSGLRWAGHRALLTVLVGVLLVVVGGWSSAIPLVDDVGEGEHPGDRGTGEQCGDAQGHGPGTGVGGEPHHCPVHGAVTAAVPTACRDSPPPSQVACGSSAVGSARSRVRALAATISWPWRRAACSG